MKNIKKVVIAGSVKLQNEINKWIVYWNSKEGYSAFRLSQSYTQDNFEKLYSDIHKKLFKI